MPTGRCRNDLATRPAFHASVRVLHHGQALPAFSIAASPLAEPPAGREALIRRAARGNAGLTDAQRRHARHRLLLDAVPPPESGSGPVTDPPVASRTR